jgi:hypothetical protein
MSSMLASYPAHLNLLDLITLKYLVKKINYEAPHYVIFSILPLFVLALSAYHRFRYS